jgi:hypothetical protein
MNYKTLEVELENGRVRSSGTEVLPPKAHALLTILDANGNVEAAEGNLADRVDSLAGIGRGCFSDLSTNKSHLDDLGR